MSAPNVAREILRTLDSGPPSLSFAFLEHGQPIERVSASAMSERIRKQAAGFAAAGIAPGSVVPLLVPSSPALWSAFVGAMAAGLVPCVFATPTFKTDLRVYLQGITGFMARHESRTLVASPALRAPLEPELARQAPHAVLRDVDGGGDPARLPEATGEVACIQHVAGEGDFAVRHEAVLGHVATYARTIGLDTANDHIASWLPPYQAMGLATSVLLPLLRGVRTVTLPPDDWMLDPGRILDVITSERATLSWWPNFAFALLSTKLDAEQLEAYDLSSLRLLVNASEPVLSRTHAEFRRRFADCGLKDSALQAAYGSPRGVFVVTQSAGRAPKRAFLHRGRLQCGATAEAVHDGHPEAREVLASGRPIEGARVRIVCGDGNPQPDGYVGEIAVSGAWVASAPGGEWQRTGDAGVIHEGELFVLGPAGDTIFASGRRLPAADLERIAASVDGVHEQRASAFGVLDEDRGTEEVVVLVESAHFENRERTQAIKREVRARALSELAASVDHVRVVPPGTLQPVRADNRARLEK